MSSFKEIMSALKVTVVDHDYGIKSFPLSLTNEEQKILYNHIRNLELENKMLKQNAINNDHVVDKVNWENKLLKGKIGKAIEILKLCNSKCAKETIDILRGKDNE